MKSKKHRILSQFLVLLSCQLLIAVRNPFFPVEELVKGQSDKKEAENETACRDEIVLNAAVMFPKKHAAILSKGIEGRLVFVNDKVWGYLVEKIGLNDVLLKGAAGDKVHIR